MSKPKSTTIELTDSMAASVGLIGRGFPHPIKEIGEYKVWREGGKIYLEVFHND